MIGLYVLFLGNIYTDNIGLDSARKIMDAWVMAGVLGVTSFTTTLDAFGNLIEDKARKIEKDLSCARPSAGLASLSAMCVLPILSG